MTSGRTATSDRVLLADIGGTNARFALMERGEIGPIEHLKVADYLQRDGRDCGFPDPSRTGRAGRSRNPWRCRNGAG